ncbi:hypothetical protein [Halobellus sp. GM3]|uniref:hypothetical protein n=1 Tax=Halobellus sp. GM3 TaxID=3458410 RepID=UPI00403D992F
MTGEPTDGGDESATKAPRLPFDGERILALALVFVVVASLTGGATTALLSDREAVAVDLTVDNAANGEVSKVGVEPVESCDPVPESADTDTMQLAERFDVEGDGCARISVWIAASWFDRIGADADNVMIGHNDDGWAFLGTDVEEPIDGWYVLTATTNGFSPFGLFVPNESGATNAQSTEQFDGGPAENPDAKGNGTVGAGTNGPSGGNESAQNAGVHNESAQNETDRANETTPTGGQPEGGGAAEAGQNETAAKPDLGPGASNESRTDPGPGGSETANGTDTGGSDSAPDSDTDSNADSESAGNSTSEPGESGDDESAPEPSESGSESDGESETDTETGTSTPTTTTTPTTTSTPTSSETATPSGTETDTRTDTEEATSTDTPEDDQ